MEFKIFKLLSLKKIEIRIHSLSKHLLSFVEDAQIEVRTLKEILEAVNDIFKMSLVRAFMIKDFNCLKPGNNLHV